MGDPLGGVWAKIRRADAHLLDLERLDREVRRACEETISIEQDEASGHYVFRLGQLPAVPDEFGVILGDAVHNLRSALDHLANAIIVGQRMTPNDNTAFPILTSAPTRKGDGSPSFPNLNPKVDMAVRRMIDEVQPYKRATPALHDLAILHALDITDKHRQLLLAVVGMHGAGWFGDWELETFNPNPAEDGAVVATFSINGGRPNPHNNPQLRFGVEVTDAAARGAARVMGAVDWLRDMARSYIVKDVIPRFETFV